MWEPRPYQYEKAIAAVKVLGAFHLVYLAMQERTGKTLTAIVTCELQDYKRVLVITKRKAYEGWVETFDNYESSCHFDLSTYQQAYKYLAGGVEYGKVCGCEACTTDSRGEYDAIILDEAHNYISAFPGRKHNKETKLYKQITDLCRNKPLIYISATPHAQGYHQIFNQLRLSSWSPFPEQNPYTWFELYGIPKTQYLYTKEVPVYTETNGELIKATIDHLFIRGTRAELGFKYEPKDEVHYIELEDSTKEFYNYLMKKKVVNVQGIRQVADSTARLRALLHMLEGGSIKLTDVVNGVDYKSEEFLLPHKVMGNKLLIDIVVDIPSFNEKIDYIKERWGDTKELVIFYNYISEKLKLENNFKNALIVQATSHAEGVDYTHIETMVVYSQDFSTARHTQRRARQASQHRDSEIVVHFLLVEKGISEQVYTSVSKNKVNFVDSVFEQDLL